MNTSFYITGGNCGLKFPDSKYRDDFWNRLSQMHRDGAERLGNRTIRFYPAKMKEGFEWPLNKEKVTPGQVQTSTQAINVHQHTHKAVPDTITTSNPFASLATNPTRPLPGLCPPPPPEMLAVTEPAPQPPPEAISPAPTVEEINTATEIPKEESSIPVPQAGHHVLAGVDMGTFDKPSDPEPQKPESHHRSKIFLQWKQEHDEWKARQK